MLRHIGLVLLLLVSLRLTPNDGGERDPINLALQSYGIIPYSAGLEELRIERFEVSGTNEQSIRESLRTNGPKDISNQPRDAFTAWDIRWRWPVSEDGGAAISQVETTCKITVKLPDLKSYVDLTKSTQERWVRYINAVVSHEKAHVDSALAQCRRITPAIKSAASQDPSLTAQAANKIGNQFLRTAWRFDRRFDRESDHGRKQGVRF